MVYANLLRASETAIFKDFETKSEQNLANCISEKVSLTLFKEFNLHTSRGIAQYLRNDYDFKHARIKFLARSGKFNLREEKCKWKNVHPPVSQFCEWCQPNLTENLEHRILECTKFQSERHKFFTNVQENFPGFISRQFN